MSLRRCFSKNACIKKTIAFLFPPHFSAVCPSAFTILLHRVPSNYLHYLSLFFISSILFSICVVRPSVALIFFTTQCLCSVSTEMPVTVKALMWRFIYVLPTLFAFSYFFIDVGFPGKEPAVKSETNTQVLL